MVAGTRDDKGCSVGFKACARVDVGEGFLGAGFGEIESGMPGLRTNGGDVLSVNYEKIAAKNQPQDAANEQ